MGPAQRAVRAGATRRVMAVAKAPMATPAHLPLVEGGQVGPGALHLRIHQGGVLEQELGLGREAHPASLGA